MKFIDEINIYVSSGKGGDGCFSFSKEKDSFYGLPDGGNGGKGGSVFLIGNGNINTFNRLKFKNNYKAEAGYNGKKSKKTGKSGKSLYINVPLGTIVYNNNTGEIIGEIYNIDDIILVAIGGNSGLGNFVLKNNLDKFSKDVTVGSPAEIKFLRLELKLLSDVGLIGLPNAGKSLFFNSTSSTFSRVGNYYFSTLNPILGFVSCYHKNFILMDIPGIMKNASSDFGLGLKFLRHVFKVKLLLHIVDVDIFLKNNTNDNFLSVLYELKNYNKLFFNKNIWLIFNKIDLINFTYLYNNYIIFMKDNFYKKIFYISSKNKIGIKKLSFEISKYLFK